MEIIKIEGPYNFDSVLERFALDPLWPVNIDERKVSVPLWIAGEPEVLSVQATGTTWEPEFLVEGLSLINRQEALKKLYRLFQWDVSLKEIHNHFQKTDLKPIFDEFAGTPLILDRDPYSCLIKCIIHQQINMAFAQTLTERFVKTYGFEKNGVYFFPQSGTLADLTVEDLRKLQFNGRKAEYVIGIATAIAEGKLDLLALEKQPDEEIMKVLIKYRGIGPWTVQNFLLAGLGRPNLFPMADIGIQNAIKKLYNLERKPTYEEMEQYKKDWEPYLSYATMYLWRSVEPRARTF